MRVGGVILFQKLYGNARSIVCEIGCMSNAEATDHVFSRYGDNDKTQSILRDLKEQGYILLKWNLDNPAVVVPLEKCQHYLAMEQDNVANNYREEIPMFEPLFGTEEEIMLAIYNKTPGDAMKYLYDTYADEQGSLQGIRSDIDALSIKEYIKVRYADGLIYGLSNIFPKCKDYPHKKAYNEALQKPSINLELKSDKSNVIVSVGDASNIIQTVNAGANVKDIAELIKTMRTLAADLTDDEMRESVTDDLDIIQEQTESPTPKKPRIEKAMKSIEVALLPIKNITTATTLLVHMNTLAPLLATLWGGC